MATRGRDDDSGAGRRRRTRTCRRSFLKVVIEGVPVRLFVRDLRVVDLSFDIPNFRRHGFHVFLNGSEYARVIFPLGELVLRSLRHRNGCLVPLNEVGVKDFRSTVTRRLRTAALNDRSVGAHGFVAVLRPRLLNDLMNAPYRAVTIDGSVVGVLYLLRSTLRYLGTSFLLPITFFEDGCLSAQV